MFFKKAFTITEIVIVMGIVLMLLSLTTINIFAPKHTASLDASIDLLLADIKQQQIKTMTGDTEGRGTNDYYGVYFGQTSYTLFHGTTYSANNSSNFTVNLGDNIQFVNNAFPNGQIVFNKGNGELVSFINGQNAISLTNTVSNQQKTIVINRYGIITQIN